MEANFCIFKISGPCSFCTTNPTLTLQNLMSNKFSGTPRPNHNHQHMPLYKLTGGYRKRLSGFRAMKQNAKFFPEIPATKLTTVSPTTGRIDLLGRKETVSTSHFVSNNFSGTPRPNHNHQHVSLSNLTGGYRKRLSGFRE